MSDRVAIPRIMLMMTGFWIWTAQFTVVYGFTALACARDFASSTFAGFNLVRLTVALVTAVSLALAAAVLVYALRAHRRSRNGSTSGDDLVNDTTATSAGLAIVAIVYTGLPAWMVPICR